MWKNNKILSCSPSNIVISAHCAWFIKFADIIPWTISNGRERAEFIIIRIIILFSNPLWPKLSFTPVDEQEAIKFRRNRADRNHRMSDILHGYRYKISVWIGENIIVVKERWRKTTESKNVREETEQIFTLSFVSQLTSSTLGVNVLLLFSHRRTGTNFHLYTKL